MSGVDEVHGTVGGLEVRPYYEVMRGFTYFEEGDVLFAKITPSMQNGKCAVARGLESGIGFGSTEFHVLRPGPRVTSEWIHRFLRRTALRNDARRRFRGAVGQQRVPDEFIAASLVPVPPDLDTQERILAVADSLAAEIHEARAIELEICCDTNRTMAAALEETVRELDGRFDRVSLGELVTNGRIRIMGGGTPSTLNAAYWSGPLPWVSPKDMKRWIIDDGQDHISQLALDETSAKRIPQGAVLVVVRGMILAHTWPIAVTSVDVAINQDMKALCPDEACRPEYLGYVLRARFRQVLSVVETSAHGTRRLTTGNLLRVLVPDAPLSVQDETIAHLDEVASHLDEMRRLQDQDRKCLDQLEQPILEVTFRGELWGYELPRGAWGNEGKG